MSTTSPTKTDKKTPSQEWVEGLSTDELWELVVASHNPDSDPESFQEFMDTIDEVHKEETGVSIAKFSDHTKFSTVNSARRTLSLLHFICILEEADIDTDWRKPDRYSMFEANSEFWIEHTPEAEALSKSINPRNNGDAN